MQRHVAVADTTTSTPNSAVLRVLRDLCGKIEDRQLERETPDDFAVRTLSARR